MVKVKNWNWRKFYIVMLFIMAVLVAGSFFLVKTHVYNPAQENGMKQVAPVSHEETTDGTDIYTFEFARLHHQREICFLIRTIRKFVFI